MKTSITKEQAWARRKHFDCQNSDPFCTTSYTSKADGQDKDVQCPLKLHNVEDPTPEATTKELAA